ncbi:MAG: phage tail tape measure protein [Mesorhizobium sp.]
MDENVTVRIEADTAPVADALSELEDMAKSFGSQMTGALKAAVIGGRELDDILRKVALNLAGSALNQGLAPLQGMIGSAFSALRGAMPFANGGVPGRVTPFAAGGIVAQPTYFQAGRSLGVMGEAGAEAIMPLQRTADGKLGVAASGGGGVGQTIVFNVSTPDAGSFRKSEAQLATMLARVATRGSRSL